MAVAHAGERQEAPVRGEFQAQPRPGRRALREFLEPEKLAAIVVLFWMSGPVAPLIPNLDSSLGASLSLPDSLSAPSGINDQLLRLSWYPVYAVVLVLAYRYWHLIWATAKRHWPLLMLLSWTCLSTLWSVSPADTARRSVALSLTTTFAVYLGVRYDALSALKLVAVALGIDVIGSAVCAVVFPAIGIANDADYPGAWRGVFASKNQLGAMMLIESLALCVLYFSERCRIYLIGLGAAFALLLLSTSKTPLFILLSLMPCLALIRRFFRTPRGFSVLLALALSVAGIVFIVGSASFDAILAFFGRDPTLTGRTDIWYLSWEAIQQRYWAGYGYGAFWANRWGPANDIWDALNWRVPSSHSGLLELWLGLGLFGVVTFGMLLLRSLSEILSQAARGSCEECLWRLGYFVIFVVHAITEPTAMDQTSVSWALFIAVAVGRRSTKAAPRVSEASAIPLTQGPSDVIPRRAAGMTSGVPQPSASRLRIAVAEGRSDAIGGGQRLRPEAGR
jgi:exopolysaccharide production protein ExoQ